MPPDRAQATTDAPDRAVRSGSPLGSGRAVRSVRLLVVVVALLAVGVLPAAAHPFFRGGEVPVDSAAVLTLAMAHGCASEAAGEGDPTTEVALEVPPWMRVVDVPVEEGWRVEVEQGHDGRDTAVIWTATGAGEPAPDFDLEVVVSGEPGDQVFVKVVQACDSFVYRWIGTPDDPADDPAVRLTLAPVDPDRPPPPDEPAGSGSLGASDVEVDPDGSDDPSGQPTSDTEDVPDDLPEPDVPTDVPADATVDAATDVPAGTAQPDDAGARVWLLAGSVGVLVVAAALLGAARLRRRDTKGADGA